MKSFNYFLREKEVSKELRSILYHIARAVKYINFSIRAEEVGYLGSKNIFGENQLALDVLADKIISNELERSDLVSIISSEEQKESVEFLSSRGRFAVAYDPLDGSSLVDSNLAIGSIFGIWEGEEFIGQRGDDLQAACYAIYGPRIILVIAVRGLGVHEFELNSVGEFVLSRESIEIGGFSKIFAPGNLRACNENMEFKNWLDNCISTGKTLRYSGGMVPDLHHILSKGSGIFTYPRDKKNKNGKLRLLFECVPFSFIFREAGGVGKDQEGESVLSVEIGDIHQTTPIVIGTEEEVDNVLSFLNN